MAAHLNHLVYVERSRHVVGRECATYQGDFLDLLSAVVDEGELVLSDEGMPVADMLTATKLAPSNSDAMRLLKGGGVYVNNARVADEKARLTAADAIGGELFILRKGRKDQHIVRVRR